MSPDFEFFPANTKTFKEGVSFRKQESKLGERFSEIDDPACKFALIGIEEDLGPQANFGLPGTANAWNAFLNFFGNIQSNEFLNGNELGIYGSIRQITPFKTIDEAQSLIPGLDLLVEKHLTQIFNKGLIPIVIGGGHNNAYPIIKALSTHYGEAANIINLDPHADCRPTDVRHSGNPFSFALQEGLIKNYTVLGLHQNYNSQYILDFLRQNACTFSFFDDYILNPAKFIVDLDKYIQSKAGQSIGIELDMDSIANMPSSAISPSGLTLENARYYIQKLGTNLKCHYLHLPEAAPSNSIEEKLVGKSLTYLVSDFIKAQNVYLSTKK